MMSTLTIETQDQVTTDKIVWFLKGLKNQGVRIVSKENGLPVSKNIPNATTINALQDTGYETVTLDELKEMCSCTS